MLTPEIIAFANRNPACFLSTCDGDQPRVRGLLLWYADEKGWTMAVNGREAAQPRVSF